MRTGTDSICIPAVSTGFSYKGIKYSVKNTSSGKTADSQDNRICAENGCSGVLTIPKIMILGIVVSLNNGPCKGPLLLSIVTKVLHDRLFGYKKIKKEGNFAGALRG